MLEAYSRLSTLYALTVPDDLGRDGRMVSLKLACGSSLPPSGLWIGEASILYGILFLSVCLSQTAIAYQCSWSRPSVSRQEQLS